MNTTIAFFGGSIPAGIGFTEGKQSKLIYPNLIADEGYTIVNYAEPAAGNREIFLSCCNFLANNVADILVVEWNTFHRFWFYPKFDFGLFISASGFTISEKLKNIIGLAESDIKKFQKYLLMLSNDYKNILELLDYCIILQDYARVKKVKIVMVNGNTPWTNKVFQNPNTIENISLETDDFTKNVFDTDNLDDSQVLKWWNKIYNKYSQINLEHWVCFTDSLMKYKIDSAPLDEHPGPLSHKIYCNKILKYIRGNT